MQKWRLIVSGRVQMSGYRVMVKNIALGLQIKGFARNLDDGTVEIYCESSPEVFEQFKKTIDVKADPRNIFAPTVEKIVVYDEKSREFGKIPADFKGFKIDYTGVDPQLETLERSEMGIVALGVVSSNIIAMHTDVNTRFDTLDTKYGEINKKMNDLTAELHRSTDALVAMTEKVGALIDKKLAE